MVEYAIEPATEADLLTVAENMRQPDQDEVWASSRMDPKQAVITSAEVSRDTTRAGRADGKAFCIFGVGQPSLIGSAHPWMLGTDDLPKHARAFLRHSRGVVAGWRHDFPSMVNYVDVRNDKAVLWLRWLGFEILDPVPIGPDQLPFHPFRMEA